MLLEFTMIPNMPLIRAEGIQLSTSHTSQPQGRDSIAFRSPMIERKIAEVELRVTRNQNCQSLKGTQPLSIIPIRKNQTTWCSLKSRPGVDALGSSRQAWTGPASLPFYAVHKLPH